MGKSCSPGNSSISSKLHFYQHRLYFEPLFFPAISIMGDTFPSKYIPQVCVRVSLFPHLGFFVFVFIIAHEPEMYRCGFSKRIQIMRQFHFSPQYLPKLPVKCQFIASHQLSNSSFLIIPHVLLIKACYNLVRVNLDRQLDRTEKHLADQWSALLSMSVMDPPEMNMSWVSGLLDRFIR